MKIFVLIIAILIALSIDIILKLIVKPKDKDTMLLTRRGQQIKHFSKDEVIKRRLDNYINQNMKYEKRKSMNTLLLQSGLNLTVVDIYLLSIASAIGGAIVIGALLNNIFAAIVMLIIGALFPKQLVSFIANKRMMKLDGQMASFIRMTVKRYYVTGNLATSIEMTLEDLQSQEPIASEIRKTIADLGVGTPAIDALEAMYERTRNKYLRLFVANLKVASNIGTEEMKQVLLDSVVDKFDEDIKRRSKLKKEINSPVMEGFLMMTIVPATFFMQASFDETYVPFMRNEFMGQCAMAGAIFLVAASAWLLINKVGAPLDKEEK